MLPKPADIRWTKGAEKDRLETGARVTSCQGMNDLVGQKHRGSHPLLFDAIDLRQLQRDFPTNKPELEHT